eukprot:9404791-Alexandrium_andersonii.AAC.1
MRCLGRGARADSKARMSSSGPSLSRRRAGSGLHAASAGSASAMVTSGPLPPTSSRDTTST